MTELRGLIVTVYSNRRYVDCGGTFGHFEELTLVGTVDQRWPREPGNREIRPLDEHSQVFAPKPERPAAVLVYRRMGAKQLVHAEPLLEIPAGYTPFMYGASYVSSSDARFCELIHFYGAVPLHDRAETWKHYNSMD